MVISVHNKAVRMKFSSYEQEINTYPRPQLLTKEGAGHYASKTEDCQRNGHTNLKGWAGTKDRQYYPSYFFQEELANII